MWLEAFVFLAHLLLVLAAPTDPGPTPVTTSLIVISASPTPATFRASQVPDSSLYFQASPATVSSDGHALTIYKDGFVWVPEPSMASVPQVPSQFVPTLQSYGPSIVVTGSTGEIDTSLIVYHHH